MNYPNEVFLNDEWLPHEQARVSVFDRGFLFGDGIYEVIPFYNGKLFTATEHLQRLNDGLARVGLDCRVDGLRSRISEAIARSGHEEGAVYIQVTRGLAPRAHHFPAQAKPTVLLYAFPLSYASFERKLLAVKLSTDFRWQRCDIKSISLMANVLINNDAHTGGVAESILVRDGLITEGSHTSVFFVIRNTVYTHPLGPHILPGITRALVISLCDELGIAVKEEAVRADGLVSVGEAFLTGTTMQVTAIGRVQAADREFTIAPSGVAGPVTRQIQQAFIHRVQSACH